MESLLKSKDKEKAKNIFKFSINSNAGCKSESSTKKLLLERFPEFQKNLKLINQF